MIRRNLIIVVTLSILAIVGVTPKLSAQNITLRSAIDTTTILVGDHVTLSIEAVVDTKTTVTFPTVDGFTLDSLEIIKAFPIESKIDTEKGERVLTARYTLTGFDQGEFSITPTYVKYQSTGSLDSIATKEQRLTVIEPKVDMQKGFVDIAEPFSAPLTLAEVLPYILGTILGGAILFLIIYYIIRYRKGRPVFQKPAKPLEPEHLIALRALNLIGSSSEYSEEDIKEYYTEINNIIRHYIERRYSTDTMELTSSEIIDNLRSSQNKIPTKLMIQITELFQLSDLVKFAKFKPLSSENEKHLTDAVIFVETTKRVTVAEISEEVETTDLDKKSEAIETDKEAKTIEANNESEAIETDKEVKTIEANNESEAIETDKEVKTIDLDKK